MTWGLGIYKRECQEEPSGNTPKSICAHNQTNKETTKYKNVFIFIFIANKYETKMVQVKMVLVEMLQAHFRADNTAL